MDKLVYIFKSSQMGWYGNVFVSPEDILAIYPARDLNTYCVLLKGGDKPLVIDATGPELRDLFLEPPTTKIGGTDPS